MIGTNPFSAQSIFGPRNFQPIRPVTPVVRSVGEASTPAKETPRSNADTYTPGANKPRAEAQVYSRRGILETQVARQNTYDLTIQTAEGDTATLHLSQSDGFMSTTAAAVSGSSATEVRSKSGYRNLDVQLSVQGNLNTEEQKAIDALVEKVNGVAEKFFAGEMQAASRLADGVNLQGDALTAFAMDLHSQEMRRVSAIYEQVAGLADTAGSGTGDQPLQVTVPVARQVETAQQALTNAGVLSSMKQMFAELARSAKELLQAPASEQPTTLA